MLWFQAVSLGASARRRSSSENTGTPQGGSPQGRSLQLYQTCTRGMYPMSTETNQFMHIKAPHTKFHENCSTI